MWLLGRQTESRERVRVNTLSPVPRGGERRRNREYLEEFKPCVCRREVSSVHDESAEWKKVGKLSDTNK